MPATQQDLLNHLKTIGIEYTNHTHPPVFTVEEAQAHTDHLPGGHCKNLYLRDKKKNNYLLVALDDTQINLKEFAKQTSLGNLSFGSPQRLMEVLGVKPGSVTPFALYNDGDKKIKKVFLDSRMMGYDILNYHPLENTATTTIARDSLIRFIEHTGHTFEIVEL
jgi:Ala-tRNA(Pro) deacylase